MNHVMKKLQPKLTKSVVRFISYCGVARACRRQYRFRKGQPAVVGILIPEGGNLEVYEMAANFLALGDAEHNRFASGRDDTLVFATNNGVSKRRSENDAISTAIRERSRVVVVAETRDDLPLGFEISADDIVEVAPHEVRHVAAACRLCLGQEPTAAQAEFIASVPLDIVGVTLRKGRPISVSIERMKLAMQPKETPKREVAGPTLDDLHGLGDAADWGKELATDLADWKAGKIGWNAVDRGILLSGPPGTGKTTFASALARTCDAHLVLGSLGRWQAKGHLGDLLKAMRKAFDEARTNTPSIIFLDEIDAIGDRERFSDHNAQYCTEVVAALLECIDGAEGREGVVVVGACNYPSRIDAALVRAGRLDRHIRIPLPDKNGREGILRWHLQGELADADLSGIGNRTGGWSGATLEKLVRDARRRARRARRPLQFEDLNSAFPTMKPVPANLRRRAAIHEAGHAIVGIAIGASQVERVAISSEFDPSGESTQNGGGVTFRFENLRERIPSQYRDEIATNLAGLAAEEVFLGSRSAGGGGRRGSDLHQATLNALMIEAAYGLGGSLAYLSSDEEADLFATFHLDRDLRGRVDRILLDEFQRAKRIIESHSSDVERIADALLRKGEMSRQEIDELLGGQPRHSLVEPETETG